MRTTLTLDDDVLSAAREMAASENKTMGEVISNLVRKAMSTPQSAPGTATRTRNGIRLLERRKASLPVTSEMVRRLREELP